MQPQPQAAPGFPEASLDDEETSSKQQGIEHISTSAAKPYAPAVIDILPTCSTLITVSSDRTCPTAAGEQQPSSVTAPQLEITKPYDANPHSEIDQRVIKRPRKTKRIKFTPQEEANVRNGVQMFGNSPTRWKDILSHFTFHPSRNAGDLKDKWRNMQRTGERAMEDSHLCDAFGNPRAKMLTMGAFGGAHMMAPGRWCAQQPAMTFAMPFNASVSPGLLQSRGTWIDYGFGDPMSSPFQCRGGSFGGALPSTSFAASPGFAAPRAPMFQSTARVPSPVPQTTAGGAMRSESWTARPQPLAYGKCSSAGCSSQYGSRESELYPGSCSFSSPVTCAAELSSAFLSCSRPMCVSSTAQPLQVQRADVPFSMPSYMSGPESSGVRAPMRPLPIDSPQLMRPSNDRCMPSSFTSTS